MSIESRLKKLESRQAVNEDHIHWMVPDGSGGCRAPNPKDCETCREADYKLHYIILFNLRTGRKLPLLPINEKQKELSHVRI